MNQLGSEMETIARSMNFEGKNADHVLFFSCDTRILSHINIVFTNHRTDTVRFHFILPVKSLHPISVIARFLKGISSNSDSQMILEDNCHIWIDMTWATFEALSQPKAPEFDGFLGRR